MVFSWMVLGALAPLSVIAGLRLGYRTPETQRHIQAARALGASEWRIFWWIGLPLSVRSIGTAAILILLGIAVGIAATVLATWKAGS
jgi:ABC-type Fe3+ transport system permease subunit